ncbi:hypothetical protein ACC731_38480, partial [Rhizobium ruizarguesonis]
MVTDPAPTGSVVLPGEVRTSVMEQNTPSVVYDGDIVVCTTLPDTVEVHTVPDMDDGWCVLLHHIGAHLAGQYDGAG